MSLVPQYPLRTERLALRPFTRGDVDAVYAYRRLDVVALYLFDVALSRDECAQAVQQRINQTALLDEGDKLILAVEHQQSGVVIGEVSMILRSREAQQAELGWIFHPDWQGQGLAREAGELLLALAFEQGEIHRLMARCATANVTSWRLMERLGMRREAHFREHGWFKGRWDEEFIYAILCDEWATRDDRFSTR